MNFEVFWSAVCADVRKEFDTASTFFCDKDIWICEPLILHVTVEDSPVGPRLSITLSYEADARLVDATRRATARFNAAGVGVRVQVSGGGVIEISHGSMLSAYTRDSLLPIVEMLAAALLYLKSPQEESADFEGKDADAGIYLAGKLELHGGTSEEHRDFFLLYASGRDVLPDPRAVPCINSVTTECPVAEALVDSGGLAQGPIA